MNPDVPNNPRDELEAKLTALLLGELPADEAFALGRAIEQDSELAKTLERLKQTIVLVKETEAPVAGQVSASTPLKLSEKRREALFQQFKTVKPRAFAKESRQKNWWEQPVAIAAAIAVLAGGGFALSTLLTSNRKMSSMSQTDAPSSAADLPMEQLSSLSEADREKIRQNRRFSLSGQSTSATPGAPAGSVTTEAENGLSKAVVGSAGTSDWTYSVPRTVTAFDDAKAFDDQASKKVPSGPTIQFNSEPRAREVSKTPETSSGQPSPQNKDRELALSLSTGAPQPQRPSTQIVLPASNEVAQQVDSFALSDRSASAGISGPMLGGKDVVVAGESQNLRLALKEARITNAIVTDPEWVGVLERPSSAGQAGALQHSGSNRFAGRYAFTFGNDLSVTTNLNAWGVTNSIAGFFDDSDKLGFGPRGDIAGLRGLSSNNSTAFSFYSDLSRNRAMEPLDLPPATAKEPSIDPATGLPLPAEPVAGYAGAPAQTFTPNWSAVASQLATHSSLAGGQGGGGAVAGAPAPTAAGNLAVATPPLAAPTAAISTAPPDVALAYNRTPSDAKESPPTPKTVITGTTTASGPARASMSGLASNDGVQTEVNGRLGREESLRRQPAIVLPSAPSSARVFASDDVSGLSTGRPYKSETAYRDRSKLAADERKGANLLMEGKGKDQASNRLEDERFKERATKQDAESRKAPANVEADWITRDKRSELAASSDRRLRESEKQISPQRTTGDDLGKQLDSSNTVAFGDGPQMLMTEETLRKLEGLRIENKAQYVKEKTLYDSLTNLPREKLERVLPTTTQDTILGSLLDQRSSAEQKLVQLKNDFGPSHAEYGKTAENLKDLNQKIAARTDGIMLNLNGRVQSLKQGLDQIVAEEEATKKNEIEGAAKARPYFEAKHDLEELKRFHMALSMKYSSENIESSLPKTTMVEVMDDARPATNSSSSLWDKLKGKPAQYESKARVKLDKEQADIPFSDVKSQVAYDPYFIQTEFETIQSDKVLGKVVKDLNLDQKWAKGSGSGGKLSAAEAIAKLKKMLDLRPVRNTSYVEIGVKEDKASEAADIANAVARSYQEFRKDQRKQLSNAGLVALKEQMVAQEKKIAEAQKTVDELRQKLNVPDAVAFGDQPAGVANNKIPEKVQEPSEDKPVVKPASPPPIPQPEVSVTENPFSTFSLNVSDVSFKLAGASLEKGALPEAAGIRSEEFINAFDYRDPEPPAGVPVAFAWDRAQYPFAQGRDLLRFSIKTAAQGREAGRPLNLVLLLDNSGSMERADRVRILREALRLLASQLSQQDKLSIITFARTPHLRVDGVAGTQAAQAVDEVSELTPQGGTNLEEAMNLGYQTALRHYVTNGINRVVLLTDGAANLGDVEPESLKQKVEANRKQGVALDCFGIGWEGYNDDLLEVLSRNGDGRYGFINSPEEAATEFAGQLAGALHVAASDVKVQVEFNPKRTVSYRQIGYAKHQLTKEQFRDNTVDAAEIGAAEAGNALYVIQANPSGEGPIATVRVRFKVPGTQDYREHEWAVPYAGNALPLEQASSAMRLAAAASAFSEWLALSPYAGEVTPDMLIQYLSGVPDVYGADGRPKKLEWMIRQAKSLSGK